MALTLSEVVGALRAAGCVFAEDEASILLAAARDDAELARMLAARVAGDPLEHIVGWAEFAGLRIAVAPGVFVPRQRTRWLAQLALGEARAVLRRRPRGPVILVELCCGAGAVAAALADQLADHVAGSRVLLGAADIDPVAADCARRNLPASARVGCGDLYEPLPLDWRGRIDVLIANAPYVPSAAIELMPPEARLHEPLIALDGGADGAQVQRRVIAEAPSWLAPGGALLIESGEDQAPITAAAMEAAGLAATIRRSDELDGTVAVGRLG